MSGHGNGGLSRDRRRPPGGIQVYAAQRESTHRGNLHETFRFMRTPNGPPGGSKGGKSVNEEGSTTH